MGRSQKRDYGLTIEKGFTLIETVIALGVFAVALAIILGVFSQSVSRNREIMEFQAAERVIAQIPAALRAIGWDATLTPDGLPGIVERTATGPLLLVADAAGGRLYPLDHPGGLSPDESFFMLSLMRDASPGIQYGVDLHGAMVLRGEVSWPFRVPGAGGFREIGIQQRTRHAFALSVRP